jgi:DNA (cytosine-5)-methyltransferase 1
MGYAKAGFEVIGIDIKDQPRYPFEFIRADAIEFLKWLLTDGQPFLGGIDLIHASPPCQHYSQAVKNDNKDGHPDLIGPTRDLLIETGKPWIIENVPYAPLIDPIELCGCMFDMHVEYNGTDFGLYRKRLFESSFPLMAPGHATHFRPACPVFGDGSPGWFYKKHGFGIPATVAAELMGTPWMTRLATSESIPPAFSEFAGLQAAALIKQPAKSDFAQAA